MVRRLRHLPRRVDAVKNISKFPHASVTVARRNGHVVPAPEFKIAFNAASSHFAEKYQRLPNYDIVNFRGCTSTTHVTVELWEEP